MQKILIILVASALSGCTTVTVISLATQATTGKSLTDHALSRATGADCNTVKFAVNDEKHQYLCEETPKYNRSSF